MNCFNLLILVVGLSASVFINNAEARLPSEKIVGGENAEEGKYTYQISLQVFGNSICGGSIIGKNHVITAAHCVTNGRGDFVGAPMKVVGGINNLKSQAKTRVSSDVEKVYITKEYNPKDVFKRTTGDIAVLKLKQALPLDSNPNLSKLELPEKRTYAGERAIITGFGWNWVNVEVDPKTGIPEETGGGTFEKLRVADVDILSNAQCNKLYSSVPVFENHICGQVVQRDANKHEGVCSGDSGGPLVFNKNVLIGVVSTSPLGCIEHAAPGVYTRVSSYVDFVKNAVADVYDPQARTTTLRSYP